MSSSSRRIEDFRGQLRKELAAQFRVEPDHPGVLRILDECEGHLEDSIAELVDGETSPEDATLAALTRFGTASRVARTYAALGAPDFIDPSAELPRWRRWLTALHSPMRRRALSSVSQWVSDIRVAMRGLVQSPGYAVAFILTLGLGIGANTAIFSVVNGIWLRPLPYSDGDRIVYLRHAATLSGIDNALFSVPEIDDYRRQSPSLLGVAEFSSMPFTMVGLDEPRIVSAGIVTGNYFDVMGLGARVGRVISEREGGEDTPAVAVLTYDYWQRAFGGDPGVVGRTFAMNARSVEIIGVAEPAPPYPAETDIYVNMVTSPHHLDASMTHDRVHRMTEVFARLAPNATLTNARAEIEAITAWLHEQYPEAYGSQHGYQVSLTRLRDQLAVNARPTMLMLLGVAAFVLVIACANVANLTLARVMRRYDEWELRISLGARTWTIRRQLLLENIVPSIAGAALGVLLAVVGVDLLSAYIARYSARASEIIVDTTVLMVALGVALAAACLFALLPRLPGTASRSLGWLSGARSTAGVSGRRVQRLLVVSQVGVSFILLVGAALLLETLWNLQRDDGGVALEEVLTMNVPIDYGTRTGAELRSYYRSILENVESLPGIRSAALGSMIPLKETPRGIFSGLASFEFEIEGQPSEPGSPPPRADFRIVTDDYFRTLGMNVVAGRTFASTDGPDVPRVVVVNQALADHYFPGRDAVGQRIGWRGETLHLMGLREEFWTIVGVVSDAKEYGVAEDVPHVIFNPANLMPFANSLFVRTTQPDALVRPIVGEIRKLNPEQPIEEIATLAQVRSESISSQKLNATLVGVFALLALTVAAVGVAGVLAFGVSQRTHEFGVRAALGADRPLLMRLVLKEGVLLALSGVAIGLLGSFFVAELISGLLHEVAPTDAATLLLMALLLTSVAALAAAVPAWRASETDPVQALRQD
jgi:predicted permease